MSPSTYCLRILELLEAKRPSPPENMRTNPVFASWKRDVWLAQKAVRYCTDGASGPGLALAEDLAEKHFLLA